MKFDENQRVPVLHKHWYPVFAVMLCSGMRVGEVTGLRWSDINLKEKTINVNHTLVYARYFWEAVKIRYPEYAVYDKDVYWD